MSQRWKQRARILLAAGVALAMASCGTDTAAPVRGAVASARQSLDPAPEIGQFVLYAERSVRLGAHSHAMGGDIGVRSTSSSSFGSQLRIGDHVLLDPGYTSLAPSTQIGLDAQVGDVQTSVLQNQGATRLGDVAPFSAAGMPRLPLALPRGGGSDVTVASDTSVALLPGAYGALSVAAYGTVTLAAGTYSFSSVTMAQHAVLSGDTGGVDVTIGGTLAADAWVTIGPLGNTPTAGQLSIVVAGSDGANGTPAAASFGAHGELQALLTAPHGTVALGDHVAATGAFAGFDVTVGDHALLTFQSGLAVAPPGQQGQQLLGSYTPPPPSPVVGPVPPGRIIPLAIGLPLQDLQGLKAIADQASDPTSPSYRKYVSQASFMANYAPSASAYAALSAWARSKGFTVVTYPNNLVVDLVGTAAQIEQALYVDLILGTRPDGSQFYAPDRPPSIDLSASVLGVAGLDDYVLPRGSGGTAPFPGTFQSSDLRTAYLGGAASTCSSLDGSGQSIGLLEFDGFTPSDITTYEANTGLTGVPAVLVQTANDPNGLLPTQAPPLTPTAQTGTIECSGDIELAIAMAPKAQIVVFEGTLTDSILQVIANNPDVRQISSSWGAPTTALTQTLLTVLAAQGQSFFEATGDLGAYEPPSATCPPADATAIAAGTLAPVTTPPTGIRSLQYVTLVGGTVLSTDASGQYAGETTWTLSPNAALIGGAGGIFTDLAIPSYQIGANPGNSQISTTNRNAPDVSLIATSLYTVVTNCNGTTGGWVGTTVNGAVVQPCPAANVTEAQAWNFGGTSAAAPLWAGFMALVNQASGSLGPVGFANPVLYAIGKDATLYQNSFHDIADGSTNTNTCGFGYEAVAGYDLATGWGTPTCGLINQLASSSPLTPTFSEIELLLVAGVTGGPDYGESAVAYVYPTDSSSPPQAILLKNFLDPVWSSGSVHDVVVPLSRPLSATGIKGILIASGDVLTPYFTWQIQSFAARLLNPGPSPEACLVDVAGYPAATVEPAGAAFPAGAGCPTSAATQPPGSIELIIGTGDQGVGASGELIAGVFYQGQPEPQLIAVPVGVLFSGLSPDSVLEVSAALTSAAPIDHITLALSPLLVGVWDINLINITTWSSGDGTCLVDLSGDPLLSASSDTLTLTPRTGCP